MHVRTAPCLDWGGAVTPRFDDRPHLVFWEMTKACLLACFHCRAEAQRTAARGELSTAEGIAFIEELADLGRPRPILILTGGDCLLRADIKTLVAHARSLDLPVAIAPSVTPQLTPAILGELHDLGVKMASLSLDGAEASTHEGIRGVPGHFEATLDAIALLQRQGFRVQINTTVMRRNLHEMADVAALLQRADVDVWEVFFLINVGRGVDAEALDPRTNWDVCHFLVDAAQHGFVVRTVEAPFFRRAVAERRRANTEDPETEFGLGETYATLRDRLRAQLGAPTAPLHAPSVATRDGKGVAFLSHNGDVYPSGFLPLCLGNVRDRSFISIYRDDSLLRSIRAAEFSGPCGVCDYRDLCGGSRARAYASSGDALGADPGCIHTLADRQQGARAPQALHP
jgi:radical SAM protein